MFGSLLTIDEVETLSADTRHHRVLVILNGYSKIPKKQSALEIASFLRSDHELNRDMRESLANAIECGAQTPQEEQVSPVALVLEWRDDNCRANYQRIKNYHEFREQNDAANFIMSAREAGKKEKYIDSVLAAYDSNPRRYKKKVLTYLEELNKWIAETRLPLDVPCLDEEDARAYQEICFAEFIAGIPTDDLTD
jgi:hypothetical protein